MRKPLSKILFSRGGIFAISLLVLIIVVSHLLYLFFEDNSFLAPAQGGAYKEGVVGNVTGVNPLLAQINPVEEDIASLIFSGLTKYDSKQQRVVPDLATYTVSEDQKSYTFVLNPNAIWHDGEPVTADDVLFTFHLIQDKEFPNAFLRQAFSSVAIEKIDEETVTFTLQKPYFFFPTATTVGILPRHIWQDIPVGAISTSSQNQRPIGAGPYKVGEKLVSNANTGNVQIVTLLRNDAYYGELPLLEKVIFEVFPNFEALFEKRNGLEGIKNIPTDHLEKISLIERFMLTEINAPQYFAVFFNLEQEVVKDWRTRLAMQLAINKEELLQDKDFVREINTPFLKLDNSSWLTQYNAERAKGSLYDAGWRYPTDKQEREKTLELKSYIGKEEFPEDATAITRVPFTSEAEVALSEEVATERTENLTLSGSRLVDLVEEFKSYRYDRAGDRLDMKLVAIDKPVIIPEMAEKIAESWRQVGVHVDLEVKSAKDILETIQTRDYDGIFIGQQLGYDQDIFSYWHSSQATTKGYNLSNFKNFKVDTLIEEIRNPSKRLTEDEVLPHQEEQMKAMAAIFRDEVPAVFLFQPKLYYAIDKKLSNVDLENLVFLKDRFTHIAKWYILESKQLREPLNFSNVLRWISKQLTS